MGINASLLEMLNSDEQLQETMTTFCRTTTTHTRTHTRRSQTHRRAQ